jgi:hypothetical protein
MDSTHQLEHRGKPEGGIVLFRGYPEEPSPGARHNGLHHWGRLALRCLSDNRLPPCLGLLFRCRRGIELMTAGWGPDDPDLRRATAELEAMLQARDGSNLVSGRPETAIPSSTP